MTTMTTWMERLVRALSLGATCAFLLAGAGRAKADPISFQLNSTQLITESGGTVTFDGTVTNNSSSDLNASDLFFNFFGFDPSSVNPPVQDLGVASDFLIPKGATSSVVALFDVTLGAVPGSSNFPVDVLLEDINSDLSTTQTVTVSGELTQTAEPATLLLLATGLVGALAVRRKHKLSEN
jgi:hypothetical protein